MLFVRDEHKDYYYTCLDCLNRGSSRKNKPVYEVLLIDESRLAREEVVNILIDLAEEDEQIFKDPRLDVVKTFKDEILEGKISKKLEKYIKFNGNDIRDVLKIRSYAMEAVYQNGDSFADLVSIYKQSRIRKLNKEDKEKLNLLLCRREIQELNIDNKKVYEHLEMIKTEVYRDTNKKRYDNLDDIAKILEILDTDGFLTEGQLTRLRAFYYEMLRRNKK